MYLPTTAMRTSPSGFLTRSTTAFQRVRSGGGASSMPNTLRKLGVEAGLVIGHRHAIDGVEVERRDDAFGRHVAELADLAAVVVGNGMAGAAHQDVGLDADGAQLLDRVLGRLGLELAGGVDIGHQGQVDIGGLAARQLVAELADGLEERQALDVADRAADLHQEEIEIVGAGKDEFLDHVGNVRDHLHGAPEIAALALLVDHLLVDAARRDVVRLRRRHAGEALVMAEVEIGLGPVVGDVDLAVLEGRHGSPDPR